MKQKIILFIAVVVFSGFNVNNRIETLISKEVKAVFQIDTYQKEAISVSEEINNSLPIPLNGINLFKISNENELLGYYYHGQAYGKADYFDFLIVFDAELVITKAKVLIYREDHGGEIGSKRWLKQFTGTSKSEDLKYGKDIAGISGATISVKAMTTEINKLLKTVDKLSKSGQL